MGVTMTFALFFMMYNLIRNDVIPPEPGTPIVIPPLNDMPPNITTRYDTVEPPIKPMLVVPPPVQTTFEPIKTEIKNVMPKIPVIADPGSKVVLTIENNHILPMVKVNPTYPQPAATKGIEGFVDVIFDVTETGSTKNIEVVYAEPERIFNSSVIKAVSRWKYKPKMEDGIAVTVRGVRERIRFNLEK